MKESIEICLVQSDIIWQNANKTIASLETLLQNKSILGVDLILFPEMFATGFTSDISCVEKEKGMLFDWMKGLSQINRCVVAGTVATYNSEGKAVNRFYWVRPDGSFEFYDKKYLFSIGGEKQTYVSGKDHEIIKEWGWNIMPSICYDLRFSSYCSNRLLEKENYLYDLALFSANWPKQRHLHWQVLLQARAIENMAYVVGVNRVGIDGYGLEYEGGSAVIDPIEGIIWEAKGNEPQTGRIILSYDKLKNKRDRFPVALDWEL